ncbi:MAG TPA: polysaccharide deacetylase family protein [Terriglobales bacterium]|nr:polysaccharide deacetylase family protein [Terriglobales bacterium]
MALDFLSKGAAGMPIESVRSLSGVSLVIPYYHLVSDSIVPHVSHLYRFRTIREFTSDLEYLRRHLEPIALSDIVDALNGKQALSRPCFHLTFDDGFREMHDVVAPILQRAGVPATFFLNTAFLDGGGLSHHNALSILVDRLESRDSPVSPASFRRLESLLPETKDNRTTLRARILSIEHAQKSLVGRLAESLDVDLDRYVRETQPYLSSEQITTLLGRGFSIGAHSHDHPLYASIPLPQQLAQTRMSVELLDKRFGLSPKAFAFPHTDSGVSDAFFTAVFSQRLLDVSFGTAGLVSHFHPRNIERVSMEKTSAPAAQILTRQFLRATYFKVRKQVTRRPKAVGSC